MIGSFFKNVLWGHLCSYSVLILLLGTRLAASTTKAANVFATHQYNLGDMIVLAEIFSIPFALLLYLAVIANRPRKADTQYYV